MKSTHTLIAASLFALLTGCASLDTATQKVGGVFGSKSDTTRSTTGGAILGCAGGALLARVIGNGSDMLKGCAAGGVVGAVASLNIHKHELENARKLANEAKANGAQSSVKTRTETAKADDGKPQTADVLDHLRIDFNAGDVAKHGSASVEILTKTARLADASSSPEVITVEGTKAQRAWMTAQLRQALKPGSTVKLDERAASKPAEVLTPVPSVEPVAATPAHDGLGSVATTASVIHFGDLAGAQ